jgi:hypothetical protein
MTLRKDSSSIVRQNNGEIRRFSAQSGKERSQGFEAIEVGCTKSGDGFTDGWCGRLWTGIWTYRRHSISVLVDRGTFRN